MEKHPIIEVITESTKEAIREQVAYLERVSKEDGVEDKSYFEVLLSGANTVINILEQKEFPEKGTENYLKSLNIEQLKFAKACAERLIKEKASKGVVLVYCVETSMSPNKYFLNEEQAKEAFVAAVTEEVKEKNPLVEMNKHSVPYEEIGDYVGDFAAARFYKAKEQEATAEHRELKSHTATLHASVLDSELAQVHLKWKKACSKVLSKYSGFEIEMPTTVGELQEIGKQQQHALSALYFIEPIERGDSILFSIINGEKRFDFELNMENKCRGTEPFEFIHQVGYRNAKPPSDVVSVAQEIRDAIVKVNKLR